MGEGGSDRVRLSDILIQRGLASRHELQETLRDGPVLTEATTIPGTDQDKNVPTNFASSFHRPHNVSAAA